MWKANWAITGLCQNQHPRQWSFSLLAGFNLADFMMLGLSACTRSHSQTQTRRDTWKHSLVSANCPALLATVYCHHTAMECLLVSTVTQVTILPSHSGMATALDVQPGLQCLHSHIPHWLPPAHTHDSPLLHMHVTSCTATTVEGNNGYHQEHKFSQPQ